MDEVGYPRPWPKQLQVLHILSYKKTPAGKRKNDKIEWLISTTKHTFAKKDLKAIGINHWTPMSGNHSYLIKNGSVKEDIFQIVKNGKWYKKINVARATREKYWGAKK